MEVDFSQLASFPIVGAHGEIIAKIREQGELIIFYQKRGGIKLKKNSKTIKFSGVENCKIQPGGK